MSEAHIYLNGQIVPLEQAAISPLDIGLLRGFAVFDLLRTVGGRPFLLAEHLERLRASAARLGLTVPATDADIEQVIVSLLELNDHDEATVRLVLTGGVSPDGMKYDRERPTFMILTHDLHEPPAEIYERGARLVLHEHTREFPQAKTTNYLTMLAHRDAVNASGALDLLYHAGGVVSEAASASVYFVKDGCIHAPAQGVLRGTIGELVLGLAEGRHAIVHDEISVTAALDADEVFLTSTTRGVVPIVKLDDITIGEGSPGPVTRDLMQLYAETAVSGL
ncbi:MAG: aminotransferase class IV [Coriobacteriia bacterium]|nr:aminotransferase class IV [Coriobacteriia bacterium]